MKRDETVVQKYNCVECGCPISATIHRHFLVGDDVNYNGYLCPKCHEKVKSESDIKTGECLKCAGTGRVRGHECQSCDGKGKRNRYLLHPHRRAGRGEYL